MSENNTKRGGKERKIEEKKEANRWKKHEGTKNWKGRRKSKKGKKDVKRNKEKEKGNDIGKEKK